MQSKNWPYFIESEIKILNNTKDNFSFCKDDYHKIYQNIEHHFPEYLKTLPEMFINQIEKDLRINLYLFIDIENETNFSCI